MNKQTLTRAKKILDIALRMAGDNWSVRNRIEEIQLNTCGYAEPGIDAGECGIVALGNWNDVYKYVPGPGGGYGEKVKVSDLPKRIGNLFEKLGIETEWSDEWSDCSHCGKLFRTSGDSYHWQPSYVYGDGEVSCHECVCENAEDHLKDLEGDSSSWNTIDEIDPSDYGYVQVQECETGWHPGQNDSTTVQAKQLRDKGIERFLFNLDENSQFYSKWSVYVHKSECELL